MGRQGALGRVTAQSDWAGTHFCFQVQWASGDSLKPETYQAAMENVTDVIHSVGLISEVDYKGIVSAKGLCEAAAGVARLVTGAKDRGNPLKTSSSSSSPKVTFEMVNRDTGRQASKYAKSYAHRQFNLCPSHHLGQGGGQAAIHRQLRVHFGGRHHALHQPALYQHQAPG